MLTKLNQTLCNLLLRNSLSCFAFMCNLKIRAFLLFFSIYCQVDHDNSYSSLRYSFKDYLILFVLSCVGKTRNDCRNSACRSNFARIYHNKKFHESIIYFPTATLHDVNILPSNWFSYFHTTNNTNYFTQAFKITLPLKRDVGVFHCYSWWNIKYCRQSVLC